MDEARSILQPLFLEIVIPGVAASAATLLVLIWLTRWLRAPQTVQVFAAPLALAAGLVAGNFWRQDIPYWSLDHDFYSLISAALAILFFAALGQWHLESKRPWLAMLCNAAGALIAAWWLTPNDVPGSRWLWMGMQFGVIQANYSALTRFWNDSVGRAGPLLLAVFWGGASAVLLVAFVHVMRFFDLAALFSSALLGVGIGVLFVRIHFKAVYAVPAMFFPAMMLIATINSITDVPPASFLLLSIAPCALLLALPEIRGLLGKCSAGWRVAAALILLCIPLAAGVTMAAISEAPPDEGGEAEAKSSP